MMVKFYSGKRKLLQKAKSVILKTPFGVLYIFTHTLYAPLDINRYHALLEYILNVVLISPY